MTDDREDFDYDEILRLPPKPSHFDPIEALAADLKAEGQAGVDAAAAIRRLRHVQPETLARVERDMQSGRGQRAAGARSPGRRGKRKREDVTDDQLRVEVNALVEAGETLTNARRKVGERHDIPRSTVRDRTK
jgi:hypothetical protein